MLIVLALLGFDFVFETQPGMWLDEEGSYRLSENRYLVVQREGEKGVGDQGARVSVLDMQGQFLFDLPQGTGWFNGLLGDEDLYCRLSQNNNQLLIWHPTHGSKTLSPDMMMPTFLREYRGVAGEGTLLYVLGAARDEDQPPGIVSHQKRHLSVLRFEGTVADLFREGRISGQALVLPHDLLGSPREDRFVVWQKHSPDVLIYHFGNHEQPLAREVLRLDEAPKTLSQYGPFLYVEPTQGKPWFGRGGQVLMRKPEGLKEELAEALELFFKPVVRWQIKVVDGRLMIREQTRFLALDLEAMTLEAYPIDADLTHWRMGSSYSARLVSESRYVVQQFPDNPLASRTPVRRWDLKHLRAK